MRGPAETPWVGRGRYHSHDGDGVVVEDCRDIFRGEFVGSVANEETGLANGTVADDNASGWQ